jgi:predicted TIM-barrel fold metal-dependent hydrolase
MIVDVHTHFADTSYGSELARRGYVELGSDTAIIKIKGISSTIYTIAGDVRRQIAAINEAGLDVRILSCTMQVNTLSRLLDEPSLKIAREINDKLASMVQQYPDRLVGMASINIDIVKSLRLPKKDEEKLLGENAKNLFGMSQCK